MILQSHATTKTKAWQGILYVTGSTKIGNVGTENCLLFQILICYNFVFYYCLAV